MLFTTGSEHVEYLTNLLNDTCDIMNSRFCKEGITDINWDQKKRKLQILLAVLTRTENKYIEQRKQKSVRFDDHSSRLEYFNPKNHHYSGRSDYSFVLTGKFNQDALKRPGRKISNQKASMLYDFPIYCIIYFFNLYCITARYVGQHIRPISQKIWLNTKQSFDKQKSMQFRHENTKLNELIELSTKSSLYGSINGGCQSPLATEALYPLGLSQGRSFGRMKVNRGQPTKHDHFLKLQALLSIISLALTLRTD